MMRVYFSLLLLFSLSACMMPNAMHETEQSIHSAQQSLKTLSHPIKVSPPVRVLPGFYVDATPYQHADKAPWLQQTVTIRAKDLPMTQLLKQILRPTGYQATFEAGLDGKRLVTMRYQGTLEGALQRLSAMTNLAYVMNRSGVEWRRMETRTFNIAFMPGTSDYLIGQTANKNENTGEDISNHANVVTTRGHLYDSQYSSLQANLSVWNDLKNTLMVLKSKSGAVMVSEATTTVTVRDTPDRVRMMARFIKQLNHTLAQQVNIKIQVVNVELNSEYNLGINWEMVQKVLGSRLTLSGALGSAANLAANSVASTAATSGLTTITFGSTPKAVINALNQQGRVSVVTQPEVTTMNNQIAEVRITRDTGYLQSVSSTTVTNEGTTTALTPGVVTDGFSLYLLPKINIRDVYLQISSTLSTLTQLVRVTNEASGSTSTNIQAIQVPTLSEKHFNQRTRIRSGQTLLITGFKEMHDHVKRVAPMGVLAVGGVGSESSHVQTLVMITPTIIENSN